MVKFGGVLGYASIIPVNQFLMKHMLIEMDVSTPIHSLIIR